MFNGTQKGVTIASSQLSAGRGTPQTVPIINPAQMYAIQYADGEGNLHNEVLLRINDDFYLLPGGEQWAAALRPAASWLSKIMLSRLAAPKATDSVDVVLDSAVKETLSENSQTPE